MNLTLKKGGKPISLKMPHLKLKISPHKHWRLLLITAVALVLLAAINGVYLLYKIENNAYAPSAAETPVAPRVLRREKLENILGHYTQKKVQFDALHAAKPDVVDPSI